MGDDGARVLLNTLITGRPSLSPGGPLTPPQHVEPVSALMQARVPPLFGEQKGVPLLKVLREVRKVVKSVGSLVETVLTNTRTP